ncbi:MAG: hypothetical protein M9887_04230 [Chitinophagales bacterium]|nr:hypothetical protein [Chitinophagales bacterium]
MKLLIVTAIKECRSEIDRIFEEHGIRVYSFTNIRGVRYDEEKGTKTNWYGREMDDYYESVMMFSFAEEDVAQQVLKAIDIFNKENENNFPSKAIIVPIESAVGFRHIKNQA